ncbi:hypothetical protein CPB83DRAFT_847048 [Crepidotus variabilis]|uniref:Uncharacterized protein n=1 Tax=Crepidotus variabilis TaxID=179855 RepID=A0A9P6EMM8_9AGAR|nr:hypothetical protein CPB83DRAFT_847048 [Crepidotus variabilis]
MSYEGSPPHYGAELHHQQQHFGGHQGHGGEFRGEGTPGFPSPGPHFPGTPDQHASPTGPPPPPSGYRIPLTTQGSFPDRSQTGEAPFKDADGVSPVFIGSALMERSVHPCKIGPHLYQFCSVAYGGGEQAHNGRFDLLPFKPAQMEWVRTSNGRIPPGRRPVEGGYEESGSKLYHAVANHNGVMVPGKTGEHLGGANVAFGGAEHVFTDYEILCWR